MACQKTICRECATEWEGINHCVACLARKRKAAVVSGSILGWVTVIGLSILFFVLAPSFLVWGCILLAKILGQA